MKLLVVGGGGREHAIIRSLKKNPQVETIFALPGNGGIASDAICVDIGATEIDKIVDFAVEKKIDYAVVAPDDPLYLGMVDALEAAGIKAFGPNKKAAEIEGSKVFSKTLMRKYGIPTADFEVFDNAAEAIAYIEKKGAPIVIKADGESVWVSIGEDPTDPVLYINDLLPHLGHNDDRKPLGEAIPGEKLNLLVGSRPLVNEADGIKLNVLRILNEKYGICEEDFLSAELSAVPVGNARDVGLDRSMICAYGHDDRVCAYPAMTAMFEALKMGTPHTMMCILADKEETGSDGNSGMQCDLILDLIDAIAESQKASPAAVRAASICLSADVSAAFDPNFGEAFEKRNSSLMSCGVVLTKYTGSRGKGGTNDASAEFIGRLRAMMAKDDVVWQAGELGKVDFGGGGTVAKFISKHNIEVVDLGVPVIAMHAPYEVISKVDLYEAHRGFSAFNRY